MLHPARVTAVQLARYVNQRYGLACPTPEPARMNQPVDGNNLPAEPGKRIIDQAELPVQGVTTDNGVCTELIPGKGQLKRGRFRHFEVFCDEPLRLGGDDVYPSPMTYGAMRVGF
jgi:hypothetical protein